MTTHPLDDLAAHVLGALDPTGVALVTQHVERCDVCRAELAGHERTLWALAETEASDAPPGVRARVIERALAGGRTVALADTGEAAGARGTLFVPAVGEPYLVLHLPDAPPGSAWEAWVIHGDRPLAAGSASGGDVVRLVLAQPVSGGDQVALTLERAGGAIQPSGRPVLVATV